MNEKNRIHLSVLRDNLQAIMQYDKPQEAFDALLYGFFVHKSTIKDRGLANRSALNSVKRTKHSGTMYIKKAREFARYCGYNIVPKH